MVGNPIGQSDEHTHTSGNAVNPRDSYPSSSMSGLHSTSLRLSMISTMPEASSSQHRRPPLYVRREMIIRLGRGVVCGERGKAKRSWTAKKEKKLRHFGRKNRTSNVRFCYTARRRTCGRCSTAYPCAKFGKIAQRKRYSLVYCLRQEVGGTIYTSRSMLILENAKGNINDLVLLFAVFIYILK